MGEMAIMSSDDVFLISLYDKDPYEEWVLQLDKKTNYRLVGTSGTAGWIREQGVDCETIADVFGLNPRLGGKVKSLNPDLYTGVMADDPADLPDSIPFVGGVAVDLTPYRQDEEFRPGKVDIGGPSLLRAAAKSWSHVTVVSSPDAAEFHRHHLPASEEKRRQLATMAIERTLRYDLKLLPELDGEHPSLDQHTELGIRRSEKLRYGENPDQTARRGQSLFGPAERPFQKLSGDDLSYTNHLDVEAARRLAADDEQLQVSVIKHANPTGWARGDESGEVIRKAWEGDPKSAFGSMIGINREVTNDMLDALDQYFIEGIVAPGFSDRARNQLEETSKPRALEWTEDWDDRHGEMLRSVTGGYLLQDNPSRLEDPDEWETVGTAEVSDIEREALREMWRICRWVNSNAAVLGNQHELFGAGAGQQSRVDAVELAVEKYQEFHQGKGDPLVLASDGFFPFPDNIEVAAEIGVDAIASPGGSKRDEEVLEAANDHDIGMIFTHTRAFYH
jgi:phosphoribosylaminoimidazolecarboxamide formyltransferase/IMP cyclohydrolase